MAYRIAPFVVALLALAATVADTRTGGSCWPGWLTRASHWAIEKLEKRWTGVVARESPGSDSRLVLDTAKAEYSHPGES